MKTSDERHGHADGAFGVDLVALWDTGDGLAGRPMFRAKAKPGRLGRRIAGLPFNLAGAAAGLMVLALVPFLAQEGSRPTAFDEGFGSEAPLGSAPFLAEPGSGVMSPGRTYDGEEAPRSDDPLAMVRFAEAASNAAASAPAPTATKRPDRTDWVSALKNAVRTAAPAAVKRAGLPSPSAKLAGALKGIMGGAGSSASKSSVEAPRLSAPSSNDLLSKLRPSDSLQLRRSEPLLRSLAKGGPTASASQGVATFPSSARPAGGASASESLRDAVSSFGSPSANGQGGGGPAVFDGGRGPGANPAGAAKAPGESLEFTRRKMEMEKEMDLKFAKRKYNELERGQMLDKVNAESAAKMKETVAGKLIDGAFGLAQKAIGGGEGGGKGNEESASAANQEAKAALQRLDGSNASLGKRGTSRANVAQELTAGGDGYTAPGMAPIVQGAATKAQQGFKSLGAASGQFAQLNAALDKSNTNIVKANDATESLIQVEDKYIGAVQQRIGGWQLAGFADNDSAGSLLETRIDAKGPLGNAANGESAAKQLLSASQGSAAGAPSDMNSEVNRMTKLTNAPTIRRQAMENRTLSLAAPEISKDNAALTSTVADGQTMISAGAKAVQLTGGARKAAETTFTNAESVRDQLKAFEDNADAVASQLQGHSIAFDKAMALGNLPAAKAAMAAFEAARAPLLAQAATLAQLTPPVHQKLGEARSKQ